MGKLRVAIIAGGQGYFAIAWLAFLSGQGFDLWILSDILLEFFPAIIEMIVNVFLRFGVAIPLQYALLISISPTLIGLELDSFRRVGDDSDRRFDLFLRFMSFWTCLFGWMIAVLPWFADYMERYIVKGGAGSVYDLPLIGTALYAHMLWFSLSAVFLTGRLMGTTFYVFFPALAVTIFAAAISWIVWAVQTMNAFFAAA
ncbi:MAG: hypothetical protein AAGC77_10230 [Pseudomonadota bacterium]